MSWPLPESVGAHVQVVRADNPGPMTLDGTNTYLLRAHGSAETTVVDPGPELPDHLERVWRRATAKDGRVVRVLLTHAHPDHEDGAPWLAERAGVPVLSPADGGLRDGQVIELTGMTLRVVATPGHTADSVCFVLRIDPGHSRQVVAPRGSGATALLTGDTVLGRGSTLINHPEGRLADYLASIERLRGVAAAHPGMVLLPGHAAPHPDAARMIEEMARHRADRLTQVREAVESGAGFDTDAVTRLVYADAPAEVQKAARTSVQAQLTYLQEEAPHRHHR